MARLDGRKIARGKNHGQRSSQLYQSWCAMKTRCTNPNQRNWHRYGGRGISVCDEWFASFDVFAAWAMDNGYEPGLTIDREDNDGNYDPWNCRWITRKKNISKSNAERKARGDGGCVLNSEIASKIKKQINLGRKYAEIASEFSIDRRHVNSIAIGNSWADVEPQVRQARKRAKAVQITAETASIIKAMIADGVRVKDISAQLGIARHTISFIKAGRSWVSS